MKQWLLRFFGNVGKFLASLFKRGVFSYLDKILPIALEVVTEIQEDPTIMTDDDKRYKAFMELRHRLFKVGIDVSTSLINLAIEMAVQKLKALEAERQHESAQ